MHTCKCSYHEAAVKQTVPRITPSLWPTGAGVEEGGGKDPHVHGAARLAHCVTESGQVQEDPQEHHDQYDGHP